MGTGLRAAELHGVPAHGVGDHSPIDQADVLFPWWFNVTNVCIPWVQR
jgi:hypothetical protein